MEKLEALRQADHLQKHNHQHASLEFAPKKVLEIDHTNGSVNSSGDGSGWTEVSVTPQVMEMKQASEAGLRDNCRLLFFVYNSLVYYNRTLLQADLAAKSIRRFLRNLDTGALTPRAMFSGLSRSSHLCLQAPATRSAPQRLVFPRKSSTPPTCSPSYPHSSLAYR